MKVHRTGRQADVSEETTGERLRRVGMVFIQAGKDLFVDDGHHWAAAIAYYSLLSIFPLLVAAAAIAAYFVDPELAVNKAMQLLGEIVPKGFEDRVQSIVKDAVDASGTISLLSLAVLLWSGSRVFGVISVALNLAYDATEPYGFWKRTLIEAIMLISLGSVFVLALASRWLINLAWNVLEILPAGQGIIPRVVGTTVPVLLLLVAFFLIYCFVPNSRQDWRAAAFGAIVATILFLAARPLFLSYAQSITSYNNLVYGSLATIVMLVFWVWIGALILLFGGEIASHTQQMLIEGEPAEEVEHRHQERSPSRTSTRDTSHQHEQAAIRDRQIRAVPAHTKAEASVQRRECPTITGALVLVALLIGSALVRKLIER